MQEPRKERVQYAHRVNDDGTLDSICPQCFMTVGTSTWEAELDMIESKHVCDPARLLHFASKEAELIFRRPTIWPIPRPNVEILRRRFK